MRLATVFSALAAAAFMFAGPTQASVIDTTPSWNGTDYIFPLGESNTATYGQTFIAPTDNILTSFTFYLTDWSRTDTLDLKAYVYAWTGSNISGPALYQSGVVTVPSLPNFTPYTFITGGTSLVSGQAYVAFLSASGLFDGTDDLLRWGLMFSEVEPSGSFVYFNNGNNFSLLSSSAWDFTGQTGIDSAYVATFEAAAAVPEPSTIALIGLALLSLLGLDVMRRRADA